MTIQRMDNAGIVVDDLEAAIAFFCGSRYGTGRQGADLLDDVVQYEDQYRLCYVRGLEGIIVALAEQIG